MFKDRIVIIMLSLAKLTKATSVGKETRVKIHVGNVIMSYK